MKAAAPRSDPSSSPEWIARVYDGDKIDWNLIDTSDLKNPLKRKRRWFGDDEFIYDLEAAPKGHLPLTSALRGTMLLKEILKHPVWEEEEFQNSGKGKYDKKK